MRNFISQQEIGGDCIVEEGPNHRADWLVERRCGRFGPMFAPVALHRWLRDGRPEQKSPLQRSGKGFPVIFDDRNSICAFAFNRITCSSPRSGAPFCGLATCSTCWRSATGHSWLCGRTRTFTRSVRTDWSRAPWSSGATTGRGPSTIARTTTKHLLGSSRRSVACTTCITFGVSAKSCGE